MPTYFIRDRSTGEIVNAVECGDMIGALMACERTEGDVYPDAQPPMDVLQRYRYWNERP